MSTQAQSNPTPVTSPCHSTLEFLKIKTTGEKLSKRLGHSIPAHVTTIAQLPWQPHTRKQDVTAGNNSSPIYRTLPSELTGRRQTRGCVPSSSAVSQLPASWPCSWKNTEMVSDKRALRSPWTALPVVTGHRASPPGKPRRAAVGALWDEAAPAPRPLWGRREPRVLLYRQAHRAVTGHLRAHPHLFVAHVGPATSPASQASSPPCPNF